MQKQSIYISLTRKHPCDLKHSLFGSMHGMTPLYSLHVIHLPRMTTNCPDYLSIYLSACFSLQGFPCSQIPNWKQDESIFELEGFSNCRKCERHFSGHSNVSSHFNSTKLVSNVKSLFSLNLCNLTNGLH